MVIKFKSQPATTIEQSERLLGLGLNPKTADMTHHFLYSVGNYELRDIPFSLIMDMKERVNKIPVMGIKGCDLYDRDVPAWSLNRLIEMCDINPFIFYTNCGYDNVVDRIEELIKEGDFNKEYLEV